ncbi:MAG: NAD-dependent epimerase/dehydratase family protein [Lachnospiraceae bacterium]|nr:NAD-dependent epimerase/dehydratase family protein [Lachnospiraceae bacterium]
MKNVLIFGGTGFIGRHLCHRLLSEGMNVYVYSRGHISFEGKIRKGISWIKGDFANEENFDELLNDMDVVFHLISTTEVSNQNMLK